MSQDAGHALPFRAERPGRFRFRLRARVQPWKGTDRWEEASLEREVAAADLAIVLCDVWDRHWCAGASRRVDEMAPRMNAVVAAARQAGAQIIHAPSDTMDFYAKAPQRQRTLAVPAVPPPEPLPLPDPPLPIDDGDGGCDSGETPWFKAWSRQHSAIEIGEHDAISDRGTEVYSLLRHLGIQHVVLMGVHTNMCVLNRSFAIKALTRWGVRCLLARDLTDAMYNPARPPHVSHEEGTELVVQHIERHWCPSILGEDLTHVHP